MEVITPVTTASILPGTYIIPLGLIVAILILTYIYMESTHLARLGNKLPGPRKVPFFGNSLIALGIQPRDILPRILEYDRYGHVVRAFFGTKLIVFLMHPDDIELILSSGVHIDKSEEYRFFKPWLGEGLLISTGDKWRTHRKIIAPTFHMNILRSFVPLFYQNSIDLVKRLSLEVGKEIDCHDYLSEITVDILLETAMGIRNTERDRSGYEYAMAVMKMCNIIHRRTYDIRFRPDTFFKFTEYAKQQEQFLDIIHGLTKRVIKRKKEEFSSEIANRDIVGGDSEVKLNKEEEGEGKTTRLHYVRDDLDDIEDNDIGEKKRLAFLDMMLELSRNGENLTDEEIKEEVDTIMFEGHDTTAAGSSFVLCILGVHQDIQARVYEELREIFQNTDRPCTYQDTLEMKYLERVILETLRLFPPVPAIARKLNQDVRIVTNDYVLPKDCTVIIPPYQVHRLPEYYPKPEVFDPDNFLPERMQERHYYSFIPFSAGPRSCVGRKYAMLKLKVLLSTILRNYRILSDLTEKDFRLQVDIILKRSDGFRIKIEPRHNNNESHVNE
ncbi:cytochrome P450 4g15-like [Prorops nasuta]|uniref:cytochrome P450 4g15-like n=1 Tax=Prorops nasuta TaxID=863751 RepID=UPI0034CE2FBE